MRTLLTAALLASVVTAAHANPLTTSQSNANAKASAKASSVAIGAANANADNGGVAIDARQPRQAPALSALAGTVCAGSSTGSIGALGFGIGIGTTWRDTDCTLRENIKIIAIFDPALAAEMIHDLAGVHDAEVRMGRIEGAASYAGGSDITSDPYHYHQN